MSSKTIYKSKPLTPKQEEILSAYVDGEASWLQRFMIGRSLQKNFEVRQYIDKVERNSHKFKQQYLTESNLKLGAIDNIDNVSLTDKVVNRIYQEERLSLLRSLPSGYASSNTFFGKLFNFEWVEIQSGFREKLAWGSLGAVCASMFILFLLPKYSNFNNPNQANQTQLVSLDSMNQNTNSSGIAAVDQTQLVRFSNSDNLQGNFNNQEIGYYALSGASPDLLNHYQKQPYGQLQNNRYAPEGSLYLRKKHIAPQVVEVDWVRSAGRVKVLRDPNGKASILWVQKKQNYDLGHNMQINPSLGISKKAITSPAVELISNK